MPLVLYDLAGADEDARFSPYCWRVKMSLRHKGLAWREIPWRFTDKETIAFSGSKTVPVLMDGERILSDSWTIAQYLDHRYPQPSLLGGPLGEAHALFIRLWSESTLHPLILRLILPDLYARLHPKDRDYFRSSREARFGRPLEEMASDPATGLPAFRAALAPVRSVVKSQPYLGGMRPSFADYIVFGALQWARAMSPLELLEKGDAVHAWRDRLLAEHDGYAAKARVCLPHPRSGEQ
jgi:glutathione S-transferase